MPSLNLPGTKQFRVGTDRAVSPEETLARVRPFLEPLGITRVADVTGLDHIGIPVASAYRPNARSVSVSQGKGLTLAAAMASATMEAIEGYHAERVGCPLRLATVQEMLHDPRSVDLARLPRTGRPLQRDDKLLWVEGYDYATREARWVPLEVVQTDFTRPAVGCSGAFLMSSNGLASGNLLDEAVSHAICELIERDANSLWLLSSAARQAERRVDLGSITDAALLPLLDTLRRAEVSVGVWETTTDVQVPSFLCRLGDLRHRAAPLPYTAGSGCHPRAEVALARAITEAAQGRVTRVAAVREDLDEALYDADATRVRNAAFEKSLAEMPAKRPLLAAPSAAHDTFAEDVAWELAMLRRVDVEGAVVVDLTRPEIGVPVVKVIVPGLEGMAEVPTYVPGLRATRWQETTQS